MKITQTYETLEEFEYDRELIKKGQAFNDMDDFLRSCVKYEAYKEFLTNLELEHKIQSAALDDITYKTCIFMREKLNELLSHHTD